MKRIRMKQMSMKQMSMKRMSMKRVFSTVFALIMAVIMAAALFAGCGGPSGTVQQTTGAAAETATQTAGATTAAADSGTTQKSGDAATTAAETVTATTTAKATAAEQVSDAGAEFSEYVELIVYNFGDPHLDAQVVIDALNEKLKKDMNCTVKWNWIPWTDYQTKYSLLLSSGEPIDITYTANWTPFVDHAQKGAFLPLNDLLPAYAPITYGRFNEIDWLECSYEGKIYAIPSYYPNVLPNGVMYRNDLVKKYNLEPVNSIDSFEAYLQAIKDNEPEMIPWNASTTLDVNPMEFFWLQYGWGAATSPTDRYLASPSTPGQEKMREIFNYIETPEFEEFCNKMKNWYERGFWSRSVLTNSINSMENMVNGRSAAAICHIDRCRGDVAVPILTDHPEWEPSVWWINDNRGYHYLAQTMQDATALPRTCKNPERALQLLERLINDKETFDLHMYGIEGTHHVFTGPNSVERAPGVDPQNEAYGVHGLNQWNLRNMELLREFSSPIEWPEYRSKMDRLLGGEALNSKLNAFQLNRDPVEAELAALAQLDDQYRVPLIWGAVDLSTLNEFKLQLKTSGVDKVQEELIAQISAYADSHGF